jgi:energy-coupling factor transporter ATP-binding protein EcfA2
MFEQYQICPYTGLRSFTEEESLYFKGREDDIDQATAQLQKNKFLMLTGASGDGKSSLIYAGIIPNARSGFLRSKYTQWCVADFRPERSPFGNLCKALAKQLDIADLRTVEAELSHGFSALVDLYRSSKRYLDLQSAVWLSSDEKTKAAIKRDTANLIILVDQFEEFFTNPENYHQGIPSRESNLVLNLLLETARIALEEDLPIYVVFTMRSDYIGQCAAFRGLPEYLGFSQFFVPRLNRSQLQQVIEEPASLSGNRISRRLTERLIHDINEGVDQLPILQHALNQIWVAADQGKEEMDLIHYAMVAGMAAQELPDEQFDRFMQWFDQLPTDVKKYYDNPNLQNVLDTHTNKLYEQSAGYYNARTGKAIAPEDAKYIIRTAFTCLTKIDQGRAVRNRMNLEEITQILGKPGIDTADVGAVLDVFREPGNTFIHPFILEEDPSSQALQPDHVLDITHESLIRNWKLLGQWAREEYDSRSVSLDFEQQLGRWVESGKSKTFLLSIGPLTYFENWFNKVKPNAPWIARYLPEETDEQVKRARSEEILSNAKEFIDRSADKHLVTRTVMRYGPKRIAAVLGLLALLTLTSFGLKRFLDRRNSVVLDSIHHQSLQLAADDKVTIANKAALIVEELKAGITTVHEAVDAVNDPIQKINLATGIATKLVFQGKGKPEKETFEALSISDSLLGSFIFPEKDADLAGKLIKETNDLRATLELAYNYNASPAIDEWLTRNASRSARWSYRVFQTQPVGYQNIQELNLALENGLNYRMFTPSQLDSLLLILSPFQQSNVSAWVRDNFAQVKIMVRGEQDYGFYFNGLYQELAYLYAAAGNERMALQCVDSLLKYNQNYFQGDYHSSIDNASNIAAVFYSYGKLNELDRFANGYMDKKKITEEEFYSRITERMVIERVTIGSLELLWWMNTKMNLNLRHGRNSLISFFFDKYREVVARTIPNADQQNFLLSLSFKNEGVIKSTHSEQVKGFSDNITGYFDKAVELYRKVSSPFLQQTIQVVGKAYVDENSAPKKKLFIYPDLRLARSPIEPRAFIHFYFSDVFMDYILDRGLFNAFYPTTNDLRNVVDWLSDYNVTMFVQTSFHADPIRYSVLQKLDKQLEESKVKQGLDFNLLYLHLGYYAQEAGDQKSMVAYYAKLQQGNLLNILRTKEFANNPNDQTFRLMAMAVKGLTEAERVEDAQKIIKVFKKPGNRSSLYAFAATEMLNEGKKDKTVQSLIDSSRNELAKSQNVTGFQPNRLVLSYALALQDPDANLNEINKLIKNLPEKLFPMQSVSRAYAFNDQLFKARSYVPGLISDDDLAGSLKTILYGYSFKKQRTDTVWSSYNAGEEKINSKRINYQDESN